jgi:TPR repeat protein
MAAALCAAVATFSGANVSAGQAEESAANCSVAGHGTDQGYRAFAKGDYEVAYRLWQPCAENGDAKAQLGIAALYMFGSGVSENHVEAAKWYRRSAEQGNADAQYYLGVLYSAGDGVEKDAGLAASWFRKAASQGHSDAQYSIALRHLTGNGTNQSNVEALEWLHRSATQGNAEAQSQLGSIYLEGKVAARDPAEALRWFRAAAEQGETQAQFDLGVMYFTGGSGIPHSNVQAYKWISLVVSAASDSKLKKTASGLLDLVVEAMTADEIAEAQALAKEWQPKKPG